MSLPDDGDLTPPHDIVLIDDIIKQHKFLQGGKPKRKPLTQKIEILPISELKVDRAYQRKENIALIRQIKNSFDPKAAMLPLVVRRTYNGGDLVVIDAQQRVLSARGDGYQSIQCVVIECENLKKEAEVFRKLNIVRRRPPSPAIHKNELLRGIPRAIRLERMIREAGYRTDEKDGNRVIKGIPHLHRAIRFYDDFVGRALVVYNATWPEHQHVHLYIVSGLALILSAYLNPEDPLYDPETETLVDTDLLSERLRRRFLDPNSFIKHIDNSETSIRLVTGRFNKRRENDLHYAKAITIAFNTGRRPNNLPKLDFERAYRTYVWIVMGRKLVDTPIIPAAA